jgi:hypothetical protein
VLLLPQLLPRRDLYAASDEGSEASALNLLVSALGLEPRTY